MCISRVTHLNESCHKLSVVQFNASHVNIFAAGGARHTQSATTRISKSIINTHFRLSHLSGFCVRFFICVCVSTSSRFLFICVCVSNSSAFLFICVCVSTSSRFLSASRIFFCFWCLRVFTVFLVSPDFLVLFASGFFVVVYWSPQVPFYLYGLSTPRLSKCWVGLWVINSEIIEFVSRVQLNF